MALLKRAKDQTCPLCHGKLVFHFHQDDERPYLRCYRCLLVFVPESHHLSPVEEKAQYDLHDNRDTPAYRDFLQPALDAVRQRVAAGAEVLDFGCGPGPVLRTMLEEAGYRAQAYDPLYRDDPALLREKHYKAITATEVVEHLRQPAETLRQLWQWLAPGGWLVIMTDRVQDQPHFAQWHYIRDPTHIAFFSDGTLQWLAQQWQAELELPGPRLAVFHKVDGG